MKHINLVLSEGQLKEITKQVRKAGGADKRFDVNLMEGKLAENKWTEMLKTVEFKKDYKGHQTGNIAVEYAYNGEPSGIASTEAEYVAYVLVDADQNENAAIFIKTAILKHMCRKYVNDPKRDIKGGDNHKSSLILLPISDLLKPENIFGKEPDEEDIVYNVKIDGTDGKDIVEYLYVCPHCDGKHYSDSKQLHKTCPNCITLGHKTKMVLH